MPIKTPGLFSCCIFFVLFFAAFQPGTQRHNAAIQKSTALQFSFNYSSNTLLHPPYVSGVINDPTDPASVTGITVDVSEDGQSIVTNNYSITAVSDNEEVVA